MFRIPKTTNNSAPKKPRITWSAPVFKDTCSSSCGVLRNRNAATPATIPDEVPPVPPMAGEDAATKHALADMPEVPPDVLPKTGDDAAKHALVETTNMPEDVRQEHTTHQVSYYCNNTNVTVRSNHLL